MQPLSDFAITERWPPRDPEAIQLYSMTTPNGMKVSIALEEMSLPYDAHLVHMGRGDQFSSAFLSLNPNNKLPAIIDPNGPDGGPMALWESGAILIYLAEKTGTFLSKDPVLRYETLQWLMFQMGGVGPMFGQLSFFLFFEGRDWEDKRPLERYVDESIRLLKVLDQRLAGREFIMGDYSIADMATAPWLAAVLQYGSEDLVGWTDLENVPAYVDRVLDRPAVQRGMVNPPSE